ncbi:MAG: hypothetical protein C0501_21285 [Isosphaera sp.]|nr:hypothetical protein [Isosphaera sp.]
MNWAMMWAARWLAEKLGGTTAAPQTRDDIPVVADGYVPGGDMLKWAAVPLSHARRVPLGPSIRTLDQALADHRRLARERPDLRAGLDVIDDFLCELDRRFRDCAIFLVVVK